MIGASIHCRRLPSMLSCTLMALHISIFTPLSLKPATILTYTNKNYGDRTLFLEAQALLLTSNSQPNSPYQQQHQERWPSLIDSTSNRTLYPLSSFRHPHHHTAGYPESAHWSPSNSRRSSLTDPALHSSSSFRPNHSLLSFNSCSPPSLPSSRRSSMVITPEHLPSLPQLPTPPTSTTTSPWRRESLPSITHLTGTTTSYRPSIADYQFKQMHMMVDDYHRHSIAMGSSSAFNGVNSKHNSISSSDMEEDMVIQQQQEQQEKRMKGPSSQGEVVKHLTVDLQSFE